MNKKLVLGVIFSVSGIPAYATEMEDLYFQPDQDTKALADKYYFDKNNTAGDLGSITMKLPDMSDGKTYGLQNNGAVKATARAADYTEILNNAVYNGINVLNGNGGAIFNNGGTVSSVINSDFIGNYAVAGNTGEIIYGGAVYNNGSMSGITGDFIGNYTDIGSSIGWAVYNEFGSTITNITGNFIGNYAVGVSAGGG